MTHEPNRTRNASDGPLPQAPAASEPTIPAAAAILDRILSGRDFYYSAIDHPFEIHESEVQ